MPGRREFVRHVGALTTVVATARCSGDSPTGPLAPPTAQPSTLSVPLMAVGATVAAFDGGVPLAITRLDETAVVAVSRVCTHQGCTVLLPAAPGSTLDCPCHGSRFTSAGAVINGPANVPLPTYPARIVGSQVVVTLP